MEFSTYKKYLFIVILISSFVPCNQHAMDRPPREEQPTEKYRKSRAYGRYLTDVDAFLERTLSPSTLTLYQGIKALDPSKVDQFINKGLSFANFPIPGVLFHYLIEMATEDDNALEILKMLLWRGVFDINNPHPVTDETPYEHVSELLKTNPNNKNLLKIKELIEKENPKIRVELLEEKKQEKQRMMGKALYLASQSTIRCLINQGVDLNEVIVKKRSMPGIVAATIGPKSEIGALNNIETIIGRISDLNPLYEGRPLLAILRELGRNDVARYIEEALRERQRQTPELERARTIQVTLPTAPAPAWPFGGAKS